jgi:hypothetical protein
LASVQRGQHNDRADVPLSRVDVAIVELVNHQLGSFPSSNSLIEFCDVMVASFSRPFLRSPLEVGANDESQRIEQ